MRGTGQCMAACPALCLGSKHVRGARALQGTDKSDLDLRFNLFWKDSPVSMSKGYVLLPINT
jgi:hypothetical protein